MNRIADIPARPAIEIAKSVSIGFFPPVLSTQAPNGILSRDPDSCGAATRKPRAKEESPIAVLKVAPSGPIRATAANPTKNPNVAAARPVL